MCLGYMTMKKACPKALFPLPHNDQVIDLMARSELLSFLDAYLGSHQIPLVEAFQTATMFITPFSHFCYIKMSFRLNNAGATYQRCMQFCFNEKIGCNLEVYVKDIMIKSRKNCSLISDLEQNFNNLW
jgi:hypothetical protein